MSFSFSFFDLASLLGRSALARERQPRSLSFGQSRVNGVGPKLFQCSFFRIRRRISSFDEIRSFRPTHLFSDLGRAYLPGLPLVLVCGSLDPVSCRRRQPITVT